MENQTETLEQVLNRAKYEGRAEAYLECSLKALLIALLASLVDLALVRAGYGWLGRYAFLVLLAGMAFGLYLRAGTENRKAEKAASTHPS